MAYTVAVSGSGDVTAAVIDDTLTDTLRASEQEIQFLVPASDHSLTAGVQAAVEWAWERDVRVIAYHDGKSSGEILSEFLNDGADEVRERKIINEGIVDDLAGALPAAALFVIMADEEDTETLELVRLCHAAEIPVFDLARGGIELDPYSLDDPETAPEAEDTGEDEDAMEVLNEETVGSDKTEGGWVRTDTIRAEEPQAATQAPAVSERYLKKLQTQVEQMQILGAEAVAMIEQIRGGAAGVAVHRPSLKVTTEVSLDDGKTWIPRGRGRLPAHAITRPAKRP